MRTYTILLGHIHNKYIHEYIKNTFHHNIEELLSEIHFSSSDDYIKYINKHKHSILCSLSIYNYVIDEMRSTAMHYYKELKWIFYDSPDVMLKYAIARHLSMDINIVNILLFNIYDNDTLGYALLHACMCNNHNIIKQLVNHITINQYNIHKLCKSNKLIKYMIINNMNIDFINDYSYIAYILHLELKYYVIRELNINLLIPTTNSDTHSVIGITIELSLLTLTIHIMKNPYTENIVTELMNTTCISSINEHMRNLLLA